LVSVLVKARTASLVRPFKSLSAILLIILALTSCGGGGKAASSPEASPSATAKGSPAANSSAASGANRLPAAKLEVDPTEGKAGASFKFMASGFKPGEKVTFQVVKPGGGIFKGSPHQAGADGSVATNYSTDATNPVGRYTVAANGDKATSAQAAFSVASAGKAK